MVAGATTTWTDTWITSQNLLNGAVHGVSNAVHGVSNKVVSDLKASAAKDLTKTLPKTLEFGLVMGNVMLVTAALDRLGMSAPYDPLKNMFDSSDSSAVIGKSIAVGAACAGVQSIMEVTGTLFSRAVVNTFNL